MTGQNAATFGNPLAEVKAVAGGPRRIAAYPGRSGHGAFSIRHGEQLQICGLQARLAKFNCLIGLNGSGKSTVLQFIDFVGQQVRGKFDERLAEREWEAKDSTSKLTSQPTVDFAVSLVADKGETDVQRGKLDSTRPHFIARSRES